MERRLEKAALCQILNEKSAQVYFSCRTGFKSLDMLSLLANGNLIFISGNEASNLAINIGANYSFMSPESVAFYGLGIPATEILRRMITAESGVILEDEIPYHEQVVGLFNATEKLSKAKIQFCASGAGNDKDELRGFLESHNAELLIIEAAVSFLPVLKKMALDYGLAVMVVDEEGLAGFPLQVDVHVSVKTEIREEEIIKVKKIESGNGESTFKPDLQKKVAWAAILEVSCSDGSFATIHLDYKPEIFRFKNNVDFDLPDSFVVD